MKLHRTRYAGHFGGEMIRRRHYGITEAAAGLLSSAGVGAATASTIADVAVPAIGGAALGAGTAALTGNKVGTGALLGGLAGGGAGALGVFGGPLSQASTGSSDSLGLGATSATTQDGSTVTGPAANNASGTGSGSGTSWTSDNAPTTSGSLSNTSAAIAGGGNSSGALGGLGKGINGTTLALGALAALGSAFSKPAISTQPTPGPSSVAANTGPYFNASLNTSVPGRTAVNPFAGGTPSYSTYGGPEQAYFSGNSLKNYGFAHGGVARGALGMAHGGVFNPAHGHSYVQGAGDGQSDQVDATLPDGSFVWDASSVARFGNGNGQVGAEKLEQARRAISRGARPDTAPANRKANGGEMRAVPAKLSNGEVVWDPETVSRLGGGSNSKGAKVLERTRKALARDAGSPRVVQKKVRKDPLAYLADARK